MPRGIQKALPTKFPPTMRAGSVSVKVKVPPRRKQPPLVKHAAGVWEAASTGTRGEHLPPTRMFIRNEDVASMLRLGIPPGPLAKGKAVIMSSDLQRAASTARLCGPDQEGARTYFRDPVHELDKMVQALKSRTFLVDQQQFYWILQGDPQ